MAALASFRRTFAEIYLRAWIKITRGSENDPQKPPQPQYPQPHVAVTTTYLQDPALSSLRLFPVGLDIKQTEVASNLWIAPGKSCFVETPDADTIPVFLANADTSEWYCRNRPPLAIFFDLHDIKGRDHLAISPMIWRAAAAFRLQIIYVKLQVFSARRYAALNWRPDLVHVLSMPLLPGGSRFHITAQTDYEGDSLFRRNLTFDSSPIYSYDWSWVGAPTSEDRKAAFAILDALADHRAFYRVSIPNHQDAARASVPADEYIKVSRASKICVSLNGNGPWCLKDGELLSRHCFVLRQEHPVLHLCPLAPQAGVHWALTPTHDLPKAIDYYLRNDAERERIRNAGFQYMKQALLDAAWAQEYVRALQMFRRTKQKASWGALAFA
jgi:hypothetical protein